MRIWITTLALALTLAFAPSLALAEDEEGATGEATGVISHIDWTQRTIVLDEVVYSVPEDVSAFDLVEPGTPVVLEYREVGDELRVYFLRLRGS
jgi:hypothetical protein